MKKKNLPVFEHIEITGVAAEGICTELCAG